MGRNFREPRERAAERHDERVVVGAAQAHQLRGAPLMQGLVALDGREKLGPSAVCKLLGVLIPLILAGALILIKRFNDALPRALERRRGHDAAGMERRSLDQMERHRARVFGHLERAGRVAHRTAVLDARERAEQGV